MAPWNRLPKDLQKAILAMIVFYGGTTAACMVCDPPPPPPTMTPIIYDPPPPPSITPRPTATPTITPIIYDPPPPPSTTPSPTATPSIPPIICDPAPPPSIPPIICDPAPPPSTTPTVAPYRQFQVHSFQMLSDTAMKDMRVQGTVFDQHGQPLEGLKVTAQTDSTEMDAWTDYNGTFFLRIPEPGAYLIMVNDDKGHGVSLQLDHHDLAIIEWVEIEQQPQSRLPLAEIRTVDIIWEDGLTFDAETPWPGARYRWSVSEGTLTGSSERVVWQPPAEPGRYLLQVVADWGQAGLAVDALVLVVEEDGSLTIC